jgi:predicted AAA+ superfamily ATPase
LVRGGFPRLFLAATEEASFLWRQDYIRTFLEQDIPALGFNISTNELRCFWGMLAAYHGNIFNASELGRSLGIRHMTAKKYLGILTGSFMVRSLKPWHENLKKRQVNSPKIYFRDSAIYHALLRIVDKRHLLFQP